MHISPLRRAVLVVATFVSAAVFLGACFGQHDPRPDWKKAEEERVMSSRPVTKLTDKGEIPVAGATQGPSIAEKYATFCVSCHGAAGDGNGPAGAALNPKPRDFTDAAWQTASDDARIASVIKGGGPAVGLSPMMAPWGGVLSDEEITLMVAHVRTFKK